MLIEKTVESKALNGSTTISVILPDDAKKPLKTLYLLHPLFENHTSYLNRTNISDLAQKYGLAVIFPDCGDTYFLDDVKSNKFYSKYVSEELVELTRDLFPLSHKREDTFIAGFSMGGYGALRNGLKYADTFSKIGSISPALINELVFMVPIRNKFFIKAKQYSKPCFEPVRKIRGSDKDYKVFLKQLIVENREIPDIFLACGKQDSLYLLSRICHHHLNRKGVKHTFMIEDGGHNWRFANKSLAEFFKWVVK